MTQEHPAVLVVDRQVHLSDATARLREKGLTAFSADTVEAMADCINDSLDAPARATNLRLVLVASRLAVHAGWNPCAEGGKVAIDLLAGRHGEPLQGTEEAIRSIPIVPLGDDPAEVTGLADYARAAGLEVMMPTANDRPFSLPRIPMITWAIEQLGR